MFLVPRYFWVPELLAPQCMLYLHIWRRQLAFCLFFFYKSITVASQIVYIHVLVNWELGAQLWLSRLGRPIWQT